MLLFLQLCKWWLFFIIFQNPIFWFPKSTFTFRQLLLPLHSKNPTHLKGCVSYTGWYLMSQMARNLPAMQHEATYMWPLLIVVFLIPCTFPSATEEFTISLPLPRSWRHAYRIPPASIISQSFDLLVSKWLWLQPGYFHPLLWSWSRSYCHQYQLMENLNCYFAGNLSLLDPPLSIVLTWQKYTCD